MEQFSLEKWLQDKSRKVVTERNKEVRIICTDINCAYPIIAAIKINDREAPFSYDINGKCQFYEGNDLFFADEEEELTKFELRLLSSLDYTRKYRQGYSYEDMLKIVKDIAKELLDLARKELKKEFKDEEYFRLITEHYKQGKQDALKDLPKWKRVPKTWNVEDNQKVVFSEDYKYYMDKKELFNKLPKE